MPRLRVAFLACALVLPSAARAADSPRAVIEKLTSAVLEVLGNKALSKDEKKRQLEQLVYGAGDFETLARLALARHWSDFTPQQQAEFVTEFKKHLSLTYGNNVESYRNERVAIVGEREEARGDHTVKSRVLRGGPDDIEIDYRLRPANGEWKIIDFIIENVSLVANYRSQFQDILSNGSPDKLLQMLRDKNARSEPLKAPGVGK